VRVLVVNAGSSSLKLQVVEDGERLSWTTVEDWAGSGHLDPVETFLAEAGSLDAVGHRVVHGGATYHHAARVDDELLDYLDATIDLAPLHNPRSVAGIREVARLLPDLPAVACFDTAFHADLPPAARTYALPREWNRRWALRRYGFHGLSHAYAVRRGAEMAGVPVAGTRMVTAHLGAGASLAAIRDGRSVDTTMGFTPLAGLVMATRSGSLDPGLVMWLVQHAGLAPDELNGALEQRSGLVGLTGSGDLRDVLAARAAGDPDAALGFDVFVHRLVREAGAMAASAGGLDVLVLTGGVGEHAPAVRAALGDGLAHLGVAVDGPRNEAARGDADITAPGARVRTVVVTAGEDLEIARLTVSTLASR
jgi:acetate kinase